MKQHCPKFYLVLVLIFLVTIKINNKTVAQEYSYKEIFLDAEYYLAMNDYNEALPLFQQLYNENSENHNINYRLGICYLNTPGKKARAIKYLEYATQNTTAKYHEGSYKEKKAPQIAIFNLGEAYMINQQLDKADSCFKVFYQTLDKKDDRRDYVNKQIEACSYAKETMKQPLSVTFHDIPITQAKNKSYKYPILSGDGKTLVFTAQEKFYDAIYCCRLVNDKWNTPINITLDLALEGEIYATSLNHDGTTMLIFHNAISSGNIYISNFVNGKWSQAKKIEDNINSKYWETFASMSSDGNTLVFTSNRKGGIGGLDIYMSKKEANGKWGTPKNLGDIINTPFHEESPMLSADGKRLYFSSQGHNTIGGFDIFVSQQINDSTWSKPNNLGYPLNTSDDEIFLFPIDSINALISTIRQTKSSNYEIKQITYRPQNTAKQVKLIADINFDTCNQQNYRVIVKKSNSDIIADSIITNGAKRFELPLTPNSYSVDVESEGFTPISTNIYIPTNFAQNSMPISIILKPTIDQNQIDEDNKTNNNTQIDDITNTPLQDNTIIRLQNILFDFDSYAITAQSAKELDKISDMMLSNPDVKLEVAGHTDSKGSASYNHRLSRKRAYSVVKYLIAKGINKNRFKVKSMGSIAYVATNVQANGSDSPEGRLYNRCVMLKVLNPESSITIEFEEIPVHLQPMEQQYILILAQQQKKFSEKQIQNAHNVLNRKITQHSYNGEFFLTTFAYSKKAKAIMDLSKIIGSDYPEAYIGNEKELKKLCSNKKFKK